MDYEKKYKEALERAKSLYGNCPVYSERSKTASIIFPELKESEDERVRKNCIHFLELQKQHHAATFEIEECIAWLEKQKKQKPAISDDALREGIAYFGISQYQIDNWLKKYVDIEKQDEQEEPQVYETKDGEIITYSETNGYKVVEPKFHEGDWVIVHNVIYHIDKISGVYLTLSTLDGTALVYHISVLDSEHTRLWTIEDAKDGDVLLFEGYYNSIVLFQGIGINGKGRINYHCKCDLGDYSFGVQGNVACLGTIEKDAKHYHPATKEQRDLLFKNIKEAGYEWDAKKLELRKIEQKPADKVQENFKNGESWQKELAYLNEKLADCSKYNVRIFDNGDGCYMCNILNDGIEDEVYAENFYEDELYDLIDSVQNYLMNKIKEQR